MSGPFGGGGSSPGASGSRGGFEGAAFRPMDGHGDTPATSLQASYLNELHLIPGLQQSNGRNLTHPGALSMLNNGFQIDEGKAVAQADQWLKSPDDMARAGGGVMGKILSGLGDVGKGFAGAQSDQTSPEEYARLDKERQQRQADEEAARLAEQQRQQTSA